MTLDSGVDKACADATVLGPNISVVDSVGLGPIVLTEDNILGSFYEIWE